MLFRMNLAAIYRLPALSVSNQSCAGSVLFVTHPNLSGTCPCIWQYPLVMHARASVARREPHIKEGILVFTEEVNQVNTLLCNIVRHIKVLRHFPDWFFVMHKAERNEIVNHSPYHPVMLFETPVAWIIFKR